MWWGSQNGGERKTIVLSPSHSGLHHPALILTVIRPLHHLLVLADGGRRYSSSSHKCALYTEIISQLPGEPSPKGLFPHMAHPAPWALHGTALTPAPGYQPNPITEEVASIGRQPPSVLLPLHAALTLHDQLPAPHCSCCVSTMSPGRTHRLTDCMLALQAAALTPRCHLPSTICKPLITSTPLCI